MEGQTSTKEPKVLREMHPTIIIPILVGTAILVMNGFIVSERKQQN